MDPTFFTERRIYTDRTREILQDYFENIRINICICNSWITGCLLTFDLYVKRTTK